MFPTSRAQISGITCREGVWVQPLSTCGGTGCPQVLAWDLIGKEASGPAFGMDVQGANLPWEGAWQGLGTARPGFPLPEVTPQGEEAGPQGYREGYRAPVLSTAAPCPTLLSQWEHEEDPDGQLLLLLKSLPLGTSSL